MVLFSILWFVLEDVWSVTVSQTEHESAVSHGQLLRQLKYLIL